MDATALRSFIVPAICVLMAFSGKTLVSAQEDRCLIEGFPAGLLGDIELFSAMVDGIRLMDTASGEASLRVEVEKEEIEVIELEAFLAFSPSSSNYLELKGITGTDSTGKENGWLIHLGTSGSEDKLELYRLEHGARADLLSSGKYIHGDKSVTLVSWLVKIRQDTLVYFSREKRGLRWRKEGEVILPGEDLRIMKSEIRCRYSSTRSDKVWIYRWCAGKHDNSAPGVEYWRSDGPGNCRFYFGEPILLGKDFQAFLLPHLDPPIGLKTDSLNEGMLGLEWDEQNFGVSQGPVVIGGIEDTLGRTGLRDTIPVYWEIPDNANSHIIISEIMADPVPSRGWPNSEYIELTNFGPDTMLVQGWQLSDERSSGTIAPFVFKPKSSIILVPEEDVFLWQTLEIDGICVKSWPGFNNSGDQVKVINASGRVVDSVSYDLSLIEPREKRDGGWSMERDPDPCGLVHTWSFSTSETGGSPALINDLNVFPCPMSKYKTSVQNDQVIIHFSRGPVNLLQPGEMDISPRLNVTDMRHLQQDAIWELDLEDPLVDGQLYKLELIRPVTDSCGSLLLDVGDPIKFGRPIFPDTGLLVISEVLLGSPDQTDFIEIVNRSGKVLATEQLIFNFPDLGEWIPVRSSQNIYPGTYLAFTSLPCLTYQHFRALDTANLQFLDGLDDISVRDSLTIELIHVNGQDWKVLDRVIFHRKWHPRSLSDPDSRSFYRIHNDQSGLLKSNWASSVPPGPGGSPGWEMYTFRNKSVKSGEVSISGSISRQDPGRTWDLDWNLEGEGWEMMVELFTLSGRYLGIIQGAGPVISSGHYKWGYTDLSEMVIAPGVYLLSITCWNNDGLHERFTEYAIALD